MSGKQHEEPNQSGSSTVIIQPTEDTSLSLALIEEQAESSIRRQLFDGRWFFSVVDVISVLVDTTTPRRYWTDMKRYIHNEDFQKLLTQCLQLKLPSSDEKFYATDCADFATLVSLVHALPAQRRREHSKYVNENNETSPKGIYAIINTITQEQYIGSSNDIAARFVQHKTLLRRGKHHALQLQEAWNTFGEEAFLFVVLEELTDSAQLEEVEQLYLDEKRPDYNTATTANNRFSLEPVSEERVQKLLLHLCEICGFPGRSSFFRLFQSAIVRGIVKPGPNFDLLLQAETSGSGTWEDFDTFLRNC